MSIRDAAVTAFESRRQTRVDEAQQHLLSTVLADPVDPAKPAVDPKTLTVAHEDHEVGMFVFTDGDVHLAVRGEEVTLVEDRDGWTRIATVSTLSDLGAALAGS